MESIEDPVIKVEIIEEGESDELDDSYNKEKLSLVSSEEDNRSEDEERSKPINLNQHTF